MLYSYDELEQMPAETYLTPETFSHPIDGMDYGLKQYQTGLATGQRAERITIGERGVWGAKMKDGAILTSYEGIGYHSGTAPLLRGFIDSGCPIVVYRKGKEPQRIK